MHSQRFTNLINLMAFQNLDVIALNPGYSMRYLTNLDFHLMERPTVLLIRKDGKIAFVLPKLESTRAERLFAKEQLFTYGDNPATWNEVFKSACDYLQIGKSVVGVESTRLRFLEFNFLKTSLPNSEIISADEVFANFRTIKEQSEIHHMKKAAQIAQNALLDTLQEPVIGKSEKELASLLTINLLKHGSGELPFQPIVSSGANSADPHATPSDHIIQTGELLLFDWGASYEGYASDITRTFAVGEVDPNLHEIAEIVLSANRKGFISARPGVTAGSIDDATRDVISQSGYGEYFFHRTGHGLGMEGHETPYIFSENSVVLQPGMVFTIEPGIYLSGKGGVRIEDDVVITENGAESMTDLPRELKTIR
jgi:Xaa-Pro dipeptidase